MPAAGRMAALLPSTTSADFSAGRGALYRAAIFAGKSSDPNVLTRPSAHDRESDILGQMTRRVETL